MPAAPEAVDEEAKTCAGNGAHGGCVRLLKDGKMMKQQTMPRRLLCAVCAVVSLVSAVPAAWAAEPDADTAAPVQSLTASEATEITTGRRRRYRPDRQCGLRRHVGGGPQATALEQLDDLVRRGWWQRAPFMPTRKTAW